MIFLRQAKVREALLLASNYATLLGMLFLFLTLIALWLSVKKIKQYYIEKNKAQEEWDLFEEELRNNPKQ